jgi:hypothetical protein
MRRLTVSVGADHEAGLVKKELVVIVRDLKQKPLELEAQINRMRYK